MPNFPKKLTKILLWAALTGMCTLESDRYCANIPSLHQFQEGQGHFEDWCRNLFCLFGWMMYTNKAGDLREAKQGAEGSKCGQQKNQDKKKCVNNKRTQK